ncbi:hypothetical protein HYS54_01245 [Candidatus Micrarchaeota archaeon]|nr:hypothetical protein [Candidatus Micrarchaeota archaeon]
MVTTIQVQEATRDRLEKLKDHPRETFDELLQDLIALKEEENLELSEEAIKAIERSEEDFRKGRVYTTQELTKKLGIRWPLK